MSRTMRRSATRCSINFTNHPWSRVSKKAWMSASSTQHFLRADRRRERIQRVVLTAPRTEAVREPEKVRFVDGVEHLGDGALDNLIFQRGNAERPLPPVRLRDVRSPNRLCSIRAPLQPLGEVAEIGLPCLAVGRP